MPRSAPPLALILLLALLVAVPTTPSSAATAKPTKPLTPKACGKGKVRLAKKGPCVKLKLKGAARGDALPQKSARRLDKALGTKRARKADKLATEAHAKVTAVRARAAAKEVTGGEWEETTIGGLPGRQRTTTVIDDGETASLETIGEAEVSEMKDGVRLTVSSVMKAKTSFSMCPDDEGNAKATVEITTIERKEVLKDGQRVFVEERHTSRADIAVKLDRNLKIADASYAGSLDIEGRGTGASARRYVMTWSAPAPHGKRPGVSFGPSSPAALAGTYRGPKGQKFTAEELELLVDQRVRGQLLLEMQIRDILDVGERRWSEDSNCVDVSVDPKVTTMAKGETVTLNIGAKARFGGRPLAGTATAIAIGGSVAPATVALPAGGTGASAFTLDADKATIAIDVQTRIGKGTAIVEVTASKGWDVTFTASGTYTAHKVHSDTDDQNGTFSWQTTIRDVQFAGRSTAGLGETQITGTMQQSGTLGTGSYSCEGPIHPTTAAGLRALPAAGGGYDVSISAFFGLTVPREAQVCRREGYGGTYGGIDAVLSNEPYDAILKITPELLARDTFTVPVTRARDFPPNCGEDAWMTCTENGTMSGTVTFTRRG